MAKHQLIISNGAWPVLSEAGQNKAVRTLVVDAKGTWVPSAHPERYLVVAPGDELEIVLSPDKQQGGSLWIFNQGAPLLEPAEGIERKDDWERVDFESGSGSRVLRLNQALAGASGESRYNVRATGLRQKPVPIVGEGQTGSLTASRP
ncbi:MAG: hypothetical protein ACJ8AT_16380 [Hyalangium sp.]|uniref:hypothetical protein n=1 Tax=Hyalangium sp. TaxID=2028555 RepID=UPI00389A9540